MALWWPGGDLIIISLATYRRRVTWVWETVCETSLLNERKLMIRICCYSQCRIFRRLQVQKVYTMDVNSLYSVIRNNSGLEALAYFLNKRPVLDPPTSTLTRLAELVLTLNAFTLNGDFYQQIGGVAMGSKMGPNYVCLLVGYVEGRRASRYHDFVPQLHKRYIDDVIGVACCSRVELENSIHFVSNFHPALQLRHTISDTELSFLDITLRITDDHISTTIYFKDTDTHTYLHHQSSHPSYCKKGLPCRQLFRLRGLCFEDSDFLEKGGEMVSFCEQRGYSPALLQNDLQAIRRFDRTDVLNNHNPSNQRSERIPLVLTYHPLNERIKRIPVRNFNILSSDPETRAVFPQPPLVAYRRDSNLRDILVHTSDSSQPSSPAGTSPCLHARCRTCHHISIDTNVRCPQYSFVIKKAFSCQTCLAWSTASPVAVALRSMSVKQGVH